MQKWKRVRIDFTDEVECIFNQKKSHKITCGKATVVINNDEIEAFAGPDCAKNSDNVSNPSERIPDLTKGSFLEIKDPKTSNYNNLNISSPNNNDLQNNHKLIAIEYLLLRQVKLQHIPVLKYNKLMTIYNNYLIKHVLKDNEVNFLYKLATPEQEKYQTCSIENLRAIYAVDYWVNFYLRLISPSDHDVIKFMSSILKNLHTKLHLSENQINAINKFFNNIKNKKIPQLAPTLFSKLANNTLP